MGEEKRDVPQCPHCNVQMKKWSVSPFNYSDGLGFGTDLLHVCFNDACPIYVKAWNVMFERYGRVGSQRFFHNPDDDDKGVLPVAHKDAMRGDIIED